MPRVRYMTQRPFFSFDQLVQHYGFLLHFPKLLKTAVMRVVATAVTVVVVVMVA